MKLFNNEMLICVEQRLGESKLSAMTESKDFRIGTRLLLWEKERLTMEYEDLQAKWTEIQQTKVEWIWSHLNVPFAKDGL